MRTTLTLEDDVSAKLKTLVRRTGRPFKQIVNDLLRSALSARRQPSPAEPFRVRGRELGVRPGLDYDNIGDLLEQIEGPVAR